MDGFFGAIRQIGYAVRDVDDTVDRYRQVNGDIRDFKCFEITLDSSGNYLYQGRPAQCRLKIAVVSVNGIDLEFIQPLEGEHPSADYLASHGEGINHLGLYLEDIDPLRTEILNSGGRIVIEGSFFVSAGRQGRFAYMQIGKSASPLYELLAL
jgi:methylmalonyl-CoA/ethylmalonyl-CoA epimerase